MTTEQLDEIVHSLADLVGRHRTTLIFVNTRKMAERLAHLLRGELGEDTVAAHHGSVAMERRLAVESRLRAGELRAVVATASLELGIDVGPVDLVCQIGSPRSINAFLQRVGRAEHRLDGVPKGRIYPMTRDELVECVALCGAVAEGSLDATAPRWHLSTSSPNRSSPSAPPPGNPASRSASSPRLVRHAAPFAAIGDGDLEAVIALVCDGVATGRGLRGAYVHRDQVNGVLRARRGASITALTSGGAIPELADYRVVARTRRQRRRLGLRGLRRRGDGRGRLPPRIELVAHPSRRAGHRACRPTRTARPRRCRSGSARHRPVPTSCQRRSRKLRRLVEDGAARRGPPLAAERVMACAGVDRRAGRRRRRLPRRQGAPSSAGCRRGARSSSSASSTTPAARSSSCTRPTARGSTGASGSRCASASAGRSTSNCKRRRATTPSFCRSGPSTPSRSTSVLGFLSPDSVREVLVQAVLPTPIFASRWRWNLDRSLVSPRFRGSWHLPPAIQRMEADDLMAAVFPMLAACQENVSGPIEIPDHPLVRQTVDDCCTEAMDLAGLVELLEDLRAGVVKASFVETTEPSVLAHEILNGRPYTFLDDAPLEDRRTRAVSLRRGIPLEAHDLSSIDEATIDEVRGEIATDLRDPDELHDLLTAAVALGADDRWRLLFGSFAAAGRAMSFVPAGPSAGMVERWCATECAATRSRRSSARSPSLPSTRSPPFSRPGPGAVLRRGGRGGGARPPRACRSGDRRRARRDDRDPGRDRRDERAPRARSDGRGIPARRWAVVVTPARRPRPRPHPRPVAPQLRCRQPPATRAVPA